METSLLSLLESVGGTPGQIAAFEEQSILTIRDASLLSPADLIELGLPIGMRNRLLEALQSQAGGGAQRAFGGAARVDQPPIHMFAANSAAAAAAFASANAPNLLPQLRGQPRRPRGGKRKAENGRECSAAAG